MMWLAIGLGVVVVLFAIFMVAGHFATVSDENAILAT